MIHVSIDYTGNIPGLGRGPFSNITVSNTTYNRLKSIGYPLKVLSIDRVVKNTVVKPQEKKFPEIMNEVVSKPVEKVETKVEEVKVEPVVETVEEVKEEVPATVDLDSLSKEELDEMLNKYTTERPARYGKPYLIRQLKQYI